MKLSFVLTAMSEVVSQHSLLGERGEVQWATRVTPDERESRIFEYVGCAEEDHLGETLMGKRREGKLLAHFSCLKNISGSFPPTRSGGSVHL